MTSLAQMLAKFNTSQQKVANDNLDQQTKTQKKPAAKPAPPKPKGEKPPPPQETAASTAPKVKVKLRDQLKGNQNGFTPAAKPVTILSSATGAPRVPGGAPRERVLGKRFKDVLDFLQANLESVQTPAAILEGTDSELRKRIESSDRVRINGAMGGYRYRPQHDIDNRTMLLNFIRDHPLGTYAEEVQDSYKGVLEDIKTLQKDNRIAVIHNPDVGQMIDISVDEDIVMQFHAAVVPFDLLELQHQFHAAVVPFDLLELQHQVEQAGMSSALAKQPMKRAAMFDKKDKKKKPRQQRINIAKATNQHLPDLFKRAAPLNIETA
eukprot:gene16323-22513_t